MKRRVRRTWTLLSLASIAGAIACRPGTNVPDAHTPTEPAPASTVAAASIADGGAALAQGAGASGMDLPKLAQVLDDPRLAAARERERVKDWLAAARAMDDARARNATTLSPADDCAWSYVAGRLHASAGSNGDAATAFDRAALGASDGGAAACALGGYALLRAGQAYAKLGRVDEAIARLRAAPDDLAAKDDAKLALADVLYAKGDRAGAVATWRALLATTSSGPRWAECSARIASALLDGADGAPEAHAREAYDLATAVVVDAPKAADSLGAAGVRARAFAMLRASGALTTDALSPAQRAKNAQAWLDAGDAPKALAIADALLVTLPKPATHAHDASCKAAVTRAQASVRANARAAAQSDPWGEAIARCDGEEPLVTALYFGGKASHSAHRLDEAIARFAKVEQLFPKHRFADDARFHGALSVQDNGDEPRFVAMMTTLPDAYPDGDMRSEALFRVAFLRFVRGDLEAAKAPLERTMAIDESDRHWATSGRAAYFRARIAHLAGDVADAKRRYGAIIAQNPLAYYMTQTYARLAAVDANAAKAALEQAVTKEPSGPFYTREHAELRGVAFERALRLLEAGEIEPARRELTAANMLGDKADDELVWTAASLFDRAEAPEIGHVFSRSRLTDHLAHYPAGRWRVAWESAFPRAFESIVPKASDAGGIPAPLTWAIMREESGFHADVRSAANAHGLMQLLPGTAHDVARGTGLPSDETSLHDPSVNVPLGAKLLGSLRRMYPQNPALAIAAYNSGSGNVRRWIDARGGATFDVWVEQIPFEETRGYVKRVLASQAAYAFMYARPALDEVLSIPTVVRKPGG